MEIHRLTRINRALPVRHPPKGSYRAETRRARIPFLSVSASLREIFSRFPVLSGLVPAGGARNKGGMGSGSFDGMKCRFQNGRPES